MLQTLKIIFLVLGSSAILATALPLIKNEWWWIRVFDFPRLQIIIIDIAAITGFAYLFDRDDIYELIFMGLMAVAALYQAYHIHFYTPFSRKQVMDSEGPEEPGRQISLLVTNVLMTNTKSEKLKEVIRKSDPDIMLFLEANGRWKDQLDYIKETHMYTAGIPLENTYGILLYSRFRLVNVKLMFMIHGDVPSIHAKVILPSGEEVMLHCLHPRPPAPQESTSSAPRDAELIITGRMVKEDNLPALVIGDMNDVAWSNTTKLFQKISGLLDPRIGRGWYATFNAKYAFLRWPLDHMFFSEHFKVMDIRRMEQINSDHFPMYLKLNYIPEEKSDHVKPKLEQKDIEEAAEKVLKAKEE
jgi:endonuclease/exonuclease/phosphatase (EEP) superfamily protein YafD